MSEKEIVLEIYALDEVRVDKQTGMKGEEVRKPPNWLPDYPPQAENLAPSG